jgi:hypothetical protein
MCKNRRLEIGVWVFDTRIEVGQESSISVPSGVTTRKAAKRAYEGAAAWWASSIIIAFKRAGLNLLIRSVRRRV